MTDTPGEFRPDPTADDLRRWRDEERREEWDEGELESRLRHPSTRSFHHVFAECEIVGCPMCAGG